MNHCKIIRPGQVGTNIPEVRKPLQPQWAVRALVAHVQAVQAQAPLPFPKPLLELHLLRL